MLYLSLMILLVSIILSFSFPHNYPYGEVVLAAIHIPIRFSNGFHTVGISTLILVFIGIYLLMKSLKKYHGRIALVAILIIFVAPGFIVGSFQKNLATGIYAISYTSEEGICHFERKSEKTLHGECELPFKNYSNNDVQFTLEFYEERLFANDLPMVPLMNNTAPYNITIGAKESKAIRIEKDIDVSGMKNHIENGETMGVNVIITSQGKSRNL